MAITVQGAPWTSWFKKASRFTPEASGVPFRINSRLNPCASLRSQRVIACGQPLRLNPAWASAHHSPKAKLLWNRCSRPSCFSHHCACHALGFSSFHSQEPEEPTRAKTVPPTIYSRFAPVNRGSLPFVPCRTFLVAPVVSLRPSTRHAPWWGNSRKENTSFQEGGRKKELPAPRPKGCCQGPKYKE